MKKISIILLLVSCVSFGQAPKPAPVDTVKSVFDTIAGDLPAVLAAKDHPYFVAGDLYVPQGKTVTISEGTVLCFKNFTGLHVLGTLQVRGGKDRPVVFTSVNDKAYNKRSAVDAAPYDWNGIYIHEDAIGTQLSFCAVMYSVDGISSLTKFFKLSPCLFLHNGRGNLTVLGVAYKVSDQPYEYAATVTDAVSGGIPITLLKDPLAPTRNTIRYSGVVATAVGVIAALVEASQLATSQRNFNSINSTDKLNLAENTGAAWEAARNAKNNDLANLISSLGVIAIGTVGICWSFRF
ncbi:MAG TPA: hypothetical protein VLX68_11435 [Chitinivibrionales bacterium]|nr:hypothetical protein [Chitinivibrionales bacterium]